MTSEFPQNGASLVALVVPRMEPSLYAALMVLCSLSCEAGCADFHAVLVGALHADLARGRPLVSKRAGTLRRALDAVRALRGSDDTKSQVAQYEARLELTVLCAGPRTMSGSADRFG